MKKISSQTNDPFRIDGWMPAKAWIQTQSDDFQLADKSLMRPCGCGIKLDLQDVVYPAIKEIISGRRGEGAFSSHHRVDSHIYPGQFKNLVRKTVSKKQLLASNSSLDLQLNFPEADSVIALFSTSLDYFRERESTRSEFKSVLAATVDLLDSLGGKPISFGKGHSIRAGGNFLLLDFIEHSPSPGFTVSNNDTIVTADSMLRHGCPISVFTAFNNSLNDIFIAGAHESLKLFPVYDGTAVEIVEIQAAIAQYKEFFSDRGVTIEIIDQGPLGFGTPLIGATVLGSTNRRSPSLKNLLPGHHVIATRALGDLSILSQHRELHFPFLPHEHVDQDRIKVLQHFCTPNLLIARLIEKYLPAPHEEWDEKKHIYYTSDISGPGLYVLEEAARASSVDVLINNLSFLNEESLRFYRKNQTSSTNGPVLISASTHVIEKVSRDLADMNFSEIWNVGEVLQKSEQPAILFPSSLAARYRSDNPRLDLFAPEVHFGEGESAKAERIPIFDNVRILRDA